MRHVSAALVILVMGGCSKGSERAQPAPPAGATAAGPADPAAPPRRPDVPAAVPSDASAQPLVPDVPPAPDAAPDATAARTDRSAALDEPELARLSAALIALEDGDRELGPRRPGSDLATQLDAVREGGPLVALGGGTRQGTAGRGDGDPRVGGGPLGAGSGDGATTAVVGPVPTVAITRKAQVSDTSLGVDEVARKVTVAYLGGLKRCYGEALRLDPALRGEVTLGLAVGETGRVSDAEVGAMTPALVACIDQVAATWRFPVPTDGDGEPTRARFTLGLELAPRGAR